MNLLIKHARLFSTNFGCSYGSFQSAAPLSTFQNQVANAIRAGRNVCIAGEPAMSRDISAFTGVISASLDAYKDKEKTPNQYKDFFQDIETAYEKYKELHCSKNRIAAASRGAIVLTPSPDEGIERYALCRGLDKDNQLRINRMGSSLQVHGPIVTQVEQPEGSSNVDKRDLQLFHNIILNSNTSNSDILFTTPALLIAILQETLDFTRCPLDPKIIVLDQFDTLFSHRDLKEEIESIMEHFSISSKSRQFVLVSQVYPSTIREVNTTEVLSRWIPNLEFFKFPTLHMLPSGQTHRFTPVSNIEGKLLALKESVITKKRRTIIFCPSINSCETVRKYMRLQKVPAAAYTQDMERESRMESLSSFRRGEKRVLVSTEIGENGIFYNDVDTVINFGFPNTGASYLKRAQKIRSEGGEVINLVKDTERKLANIIKALIERKAPIDPLLSINSIQLT